MGWNGHERALVVGAAVVVAGGVSGGILVYSYRHIIASRLLMWRTRWLVTAARRKIHVVKSEQDWNKLFPQLLSEARREGAVGLDCEWTNEDGKRRPVAILQLATVSGLCVLVRLPHLYPTLPSSLKRFLEDESILKVGVATPEDSSLLAVDHCLTVHGCVDLRYLAIQVEEGQKDVTGRDAAAEGGPDNSVGIPRLGLNALAVRHLGRTLDKGYKVRAGNWDAERLSKRQINYAAEDALVGAHLLLVLGVRLLWNRGTHHPVLPSPPLLPLLLPFPLWHKHLASHLRLACLPYCDKKFKYLSTWRGGPPAGSSSSAASKLNARPLKEEYVGCNEKGGQGLRRGHPPLQRPLYNNCWLEAPDGMPLCTCDIKKAQWYVARGLGHEMSRDPLVVRLTFEPSGRPEPASGDHQFYTQQRDNICVVCGASGDLSRKSVVPHEYRCHFPSLLKNHSSHDLVLLCLNCHHIASLADTALRNALAQECHPQSSPATKPRVAVDRNLKAVKNAAGALLRSHAQLPLARVQQLEEVVRVHFGEVTPATLQAGAELDTRLINEDFVPHGLIVVQHYQKYGGLMALQQRWRTHFMNTLQPHHLPVLWSPSHGITTLTSAAAALPPNHPDKPIYASILTGLESIKLSTNNYTSVLSIHNCEVTGNNFSPCQNKNSSPQVITTGTKP